MIKDYAAHHTSIRKCVLLITLALTMVLASLGAASGVMAKEPTGDFAVFKQCPRFTPGVNLCVYSTVTGETIIGKLSMPIVNPITLQLGLIRTEEPVEEKVVAPINGETISPTPQPVPGGLSSLIHCDEINDHGFRGHPRRRLCRTLFENPRSSQVYETTELAGATSEIYVSRRNALLEEGPSFAYPAKIHLENPLLGKDCYIGSNTTPLMFSLTTGATNPPAPNQPIHGAVGPFTLKDEFEFVENTGHIEVNNTFSAPTATGCGGPLSSIIDQLIDNTIGLPSPPGHNTVIHQGTLDEATTTGVIKSEQAQPNEKHH